MSMLRRISCDLLTVPAVRHSRTSWIRRGFDKRLESTRSTQSASPLAPIGVNAAIQASQDPTITPQPKIFDEFSLKDRVGIVTGGNRGLGLEMALVLCEAGARATYVIDQTPEPSKEWQNTREYVERMNHGSRLEYISMDVRDQKGVWGKVEEIGDKEGRMDVSSSFQKTLDINVNGVLHAAQAAGQQMVRFGNSGSIIMIASVAGSKALRYGSDVIAYNTSKSAVLQMARSMAVELAPKHIRVNAISPGYILSPMTAPSLEVPEILKKISTVHPMGRVGRPDELRGVVAWLASDASSFCTGGNIPVCGGYHAW